MNRPTTETDVMVLTPGQYAVSLALRNASALAGCTNVTTDDDGRLLLVRKWSQLSSGEERLWLTMAWLNGQAGYPDLDDLRAHLDEDNLAAAMAAVTS